MVEFVGPVSYRLVADCHNHYRWGRVLINCRKLAKATETGRDSDNKASINSFNHLRMFFTPLNPLLRGGSISRFGPSCFFPPLRASALLIPTTPYLTMLRTAVRRNLLRFNSLAAAAPKLFQKTAATLPNSTNDFVLTKLVHGSTDLSIAITARARDKLYSIANGDKNPETALKIGVESGGCHGFQYNLDLLELSKELEKQADALVFKRSDGEAGEYGVAQLVMDEASLEILQDLKIDYTKELIGSQFKVVDSPYTLTECGCGSSFDFDFDKLEKKKAEKGQ